MNFTLCEKKMRLRFSVKCTSALEISLNFAFAVAVPNVPYIIGVAIRAKTSALANSLARAIFDFRCLVRTNHLPLIGQVSYDVK